MATGDRQGASEWLPVELAPPETEAPDEVSDESDDRSDEEQSPGEAVEGSATVEEQDEDGEPSRPSGEAEIERLLERAERTQGALSKAEVRSEGAEERARLIAPAESALRRAAAAEARARKAAETAERLAAKVIVLTDRLAAQGKELERQRQEAAAVVDDEHEQEPELEAEPEPQPEPEPEPEPGPEPAPQPEQAPVAERSFDINQATFEELCQLGLSINQAARLIGQRDQRGGFSSVDDLDGLRGLPGDTIEMLKDAASS